MTGAAAEGLSNVPDRKHFTQAEAEYISDKNMVELHQILSAVIVSENLLWATGRRHTCYLQHSKCTCSTLDRNA